MNMNNTILEDVRDKITERRQTNIEVGMGKPSEVHLAPIVYKAVRRELEKMYIGNMSIELDDEEFRIDGVTVREKKGMSAIQIR